MDKNILGKIKKLMNLADITRNSNVEEAAAAATKAQELLFQHNLALADIEKFDLDTSEKIGREDYSPESTKENVKWHMILLWGIAKTNFCKGVRLSSNSSKMALIGKPSNIQVVKYFYEYLAREIDRLAHEHCKLEGIIDRKRAWKNSFRLGATYTVRARLEEQLKASSQQDSKCTALVATNKKELDKVTHEHFPQLSRTPQNTRTSNRDGFFSGTQVGKTIPLGLGISSRASNRALT